MHFLKTLFVFKGENPEPQQLFFSAPITAKTLVGLKTDHLDVKLISESCRMVIVSSALTGL